MQIKNGGRGENEFCFASMAGGEGMSERIDLDAHIPYGTYYLEHVGKAKISGDQLLGLCPFHTDNDESFSVNLITGQHHCFGCGQSGNVISFHAKKHGLSEKEAFQDLCKTYNVPSSGARTKSDDEKIIPIETLDLFKVIPDAVLQYLQERRGWSLEIIGQYRIGYNAKKIFKPGFVDAQRITIPVLDDLGRLVNLRSYKPKVAEGESKLMSYSTGSRKKGTWVGYGQARLSPLHVIREAEEQDEIIYIVEGEPDCLCGLSHDLKSITQTAGAETWNDEWNPKFKGVHVRIAYDNDEAGVKGILRIIQHLPAFCKKVECRVWPDFMGEKEDLTDWFMKHKKTKEDLEAIEWISAEEFKKRFGEAGPGGTDEDPVDRCVRELNEKHAILMLGGKCLVMNEIIDPIFGRPDLTFSSPADFKTFHQNQKIFIPNGTGKIKAVSIANIWLEHENRRQYNGMVFAPGEDVPGCYNLFRGMAYEPKKGSWKRLQEHIYHVICRKDAAIFEYILAWMADAIQNPGGERPGVSIVMRGGKGTGKGIFARTFGELFGGHFLHITHQSQLVGKFNQHQKDALVVFADECFWAGDKLSESIIKGIITEPTIRVEPKGKDSFPVKNHMRLMVGSNEDWVIPAGIGERRFLVIDVAEIYRQDLKYFAPIHAEIKNGGHAAMLFDLMEHKYDQTALMLAPKTDALLAQIEEGLEPVQKFWLDKLQQASPEGNDVHWPDSIPSAKLYSEFIEFNKKLGHNYAPAPNSFGRRIKKLCPGLKRRYLTRTDGAGQEWWFVFPILDDCRKSFEKVLGQTIEWTEDDV